MNLTRRDFIKGGLAVVSAGASVPSIFARAAHASILESVHGAPALAANGKTLVVIQMSGGNDGLNTLVPYTNPIYRQMRARLGLPEDQLLPLDGTFALHPRLGPLQKLFIEGKLAAIDGVGYPNPSRSHFRAMEIWQGADPIGLPDDGWLGRYLQTVDDQGHVLEGVNLGASLPRSLLSTEPIPSVADVATYRVQAPEGNIGERRTNAMLRMYSAYPHFAPYAALLDTTATEAFRTSKAIQASAEGYQPAVAYPRSSFGNGLRAVAQIIDADLGARVCHVTLGGFDTHVTQPAIHDRLLGDLAAGIDALQTDLQAHGRADDTLIMTWSEFGRRLKENANGGTDHGAPGPMFIVGNAVKPGLYGAPMDLKTLQDGDPHFTTDFRAVYGTILDTWMGADSRGLLGGAYPRVPFL